MLPPVLLANSLVLKFSGSPQSHNGRSNPHKIPESLNFNGMLKLIDSSAEDRVLTLRWSLLTGVIAIMCAGGRRPNVHAHVLRPEVELER